MNGSRVLIVEDDESILELMKEMVSSSGCDVITAPDGLRALELVKGGQEFDMVITDLSMPGIDGRRLVVMLREMGFDKPIIAITGYVLHDPVEGADKTLHKPFRMDEFVAEIEASLDE